MVELDASEAEAFTIGSLRGTAGWDGDDDLLTHLDLGPAIRDALERVPEPFRSTVLIVDVEDQSYESAAASLGVPIGTVRSRLFRGRRLMHKRLSTYATDAGFGPRAA